MLLRNTLLAILATCTVASPIWPFDKLPGKKEPIKSNTKQTSTVAGRGFDRFVTVWFENTDFEKADGDPNFEWLYQQGIKHTNYIANHHPSQPNYWAAVAGDNFFWLDDFDHYIKGKTTIVDLLEAKGISWAAYQEDMPVVGYTGHNYKNDKGQVNYVRKHNPFISFETIYENQDRLNQIKPLTMFYDELRANQLPQYMFITPNMTSDGHDTSITHAGQWARQFLEPLLSDRNFMQRTLLHVVWDENHLWFIKKNRVLSLLIGDAVPSNFVGKEDNTQYSHHSQIKSIEANWDLGSLGRGDKKANAFANLGL